MHTSIIITQQAKVSICIRHYWQTNMKFDRSHPVVLHQYKRAISPQLLFYYMNIWINIVSIMGSHEVHILYIWTLLLYWPDDGYTQPKHVAVRKTDNCHVYDKTVVFIDWLIYFYINMKSPYAYINHYYRTSYIAESPCRRKPNEYQTTLYQSRS